jgi:hypothetical protein
MPLFGTALRPTRPLLQHPRADRLLRKAELCLQLFPELAEHQITVGITRAAEGIAVLDDMTVRFDLRRRVPSNYVIGHELTHLLQALRLVPHGEVQCDVWTLARHPVFLDEAPCYLELPAALRADWTHHARSIGELCRRSIEVRTHRRTYLQWLGHRIDEITAGQSA